MEERCCTRVCHCVLLSFWKEGIFGGFVICPSFFLLLSFWRFHPYFHSFSAVHCVGTFLLCNWRKRVLFITAEDTQLLICKDSFPSNFVSFLNCLHPPHPPSTAFSPLANSCCAKERSLSRTQNSSPRLSFPLPPLFSSLLSFSLLSSPILPSSVASKAAGARATQGKDRSSPACRIQRPCKAASLI